MDLNSLRIFLTVAELGSVSKAAERLNYVQSNVTARIKNLEEELKIQLFYRQSRGMLLTPAGESLVKYARKMILLAQEAKDAIDGDGCPKGKITVGAMETTAAIRLPQHLVAFHRNYPQVEINLHTGTSAELRQMVLEYELEGAFVGGAFNHPDIEQEEVFGEELVLVTQAGITGLEDPNVGALIGFKKGCSYQEQLNDWVAELGRSPLKVMQFGSLEAILGCVLAGMGVAFLPKSVMEHERYRKGLKLHPVPDDFAKITTMFVRRKDMPPSKNLSAFLDLLMSPKESRH